LKGISLIRFLDIAFRLEHEFGIKIPRGELFSDRVFELCTRIVRDVQVTDEGLAALRLAMPYADLTVLERDRRLNRVDDLFTIDHLTRYITWKLHANGEAQATPASMPVA
jgi:acyl carrier protein